MSVNDRDLARHRASFSDFRHIIAFAAFHVAQALAYVALAFVGHACWIALPIWIGGTMMLVIGIAIHSGNDASRQGDASVSEN